MSKMTKKPRAGKIPRDLSDKDMFRDYVEEETIEAKFEALGKKEEKQRKEKEEMEPPANLAKAGLTADIMDRLGKELLQLKMELFREDIKDYTMQIKREGKKILLIPVERSGK